MLEGDVAGLGDAERVGLLRDVHRLVEVLEDPVEERERGLHVEPDAEQRADREEEPRLQRRERDQRGDRDRGRAAREREPAEPVDRAGMIAKLVWIDAITQRPAIRWRTSSSASRSESRLEAVGELVAAAHRLAEQDPGDRERLLDEARDVGQRLLRRLRDPRAARCRRGG